MPYSAPYIYYVAKVIPSMVKRYLQRCFQVSEDMAVHTIISTVVTSAPLWFNLVGRRIFWSSYWACQEP